MSHLRLKRRLRCALAAFALVALRAFGRSWAQNAQRPTPFGQVASSHSHSRVGTRAWVLIHPFIDTHTLDPVAGPPCVGTAPSPSLPPLGWPLPSRKPMHAAGVQTTPRMRHVSHDRTRELERRKRDVTRRVRSVSLSGLARRLGSRSRSSRRYTVDGTSLKSQHLQYFRTGRHSSVRVASFHYYFTKVKAQCSRFTGKKWYIPLFD